MEDGERIVYRQSNGVTIRDSLAGGERVCWRTASLCYSTSFEMRVRGAPIQGRVCVSASRPCAYRDGHFAVRQTQKLNNKALPS